MLAPAAMLSQNVIAELAHTGAEIAQYVFIAAGIISTQLVLPP